MTVTFNTAPTLDKIKIAAMRSIIRGVEAIRKEATRSIMRGKKSGIIYHRRGVTHQASAPGEAPAADTGELAGSITTEYNAKLLTGTITAKAIYAAALEFGTQTIEPRPFMRPALDSQRARIQEELQAAVAKALKSSQ